MEKFLFTEKSMFLGIKRKKSEKGYYFGTLFALYNIR